MIYNVTRLSSEQAKYLLNRISFVLEWFVVFIYRYIVDKGAIQILCFHLNTQISDIVLMSLENILRWGAKESQQTNKHNPYAIIMKDLHGL